MILFIDGNSTTASVRAVTVLLTCPAHDCMYLIVVVEYYIYMYCTYVFTVGCDDTEGGWHGNPLFPSAPATKRTHRALTPRPPRANINFPTAQGVATLEHHSVQSTTSRKRISTYQLRTKHRLINNSSVHISRNGTYGPQEDPAAVMPSCATMNQGLRATEPNPNRRACQQQHHPSAARSFPQPSSYLR